MDERYYTSSQSVAVPSYHSMIELPCLLYKAVVMFCVAITITSSMLNLHEVG